MILEKIDTYMCDNKLDEAWKNEAKLIQEYIESLTLMKESLEKILKSGEFVKVSKIDKEVKKIIIDFRESSVLNKY